MANTKTLNDTVAARIRAVMGAKKISVADYAKALGQSQDMTSRRINGSVELKLGEIECFAKLAGYSYRDFFNDTFEIKPALAEEGTR